MRSDWLVVAALSLTTTLTSCSTGASSTAATAQTTTTTLSRAATVQRVSVLLAPLGPSIKSAEGSTKPNEFESAAVVARSAGFGLHALSYRPTASIDAVALVAALQTLSSDADQAASPEANLGAIAQIIQNDYSAVMHDGANLIGVLNNQAG